MKCIRYYLLNDIATVIMRSAVPTWKNSTQLGLWTVDSPSWWKLMRRAAKLSTEYPATLASLLCALLSKLPIASKSQGRADWERLGRRDSHCSYGEVTLCAWCRLPSAAVWGDPYAVSNPLPMSSKPNELIGLCGEIQGIDMWHISHYLKFSGT